MESSDGLLKPSIHCKSFWNLFLELQYKINCSGLFQIKGSLWNLCAMYAGLYSWLQHHSPWLVYSKLLDSGFCLPCVLFSKPSANVDAGVLVTRPLTSFNKACELLRKHSTQVKYHTNALKDMTCFLNTMEKNHPVYSLANTAHARLVEQNRLKLKSIIKCIVWCAKQNIPLRGHWDDDTCLGGNPGNFKALKFRVDSGDHYIKRAFRESPPPPPKNIPPRQFKTSSSMSQENG